MWSKGHDLYNIQRKVAEKRLNLLSSYPINLLIVDVEPKHKTIDRWQLMPKTE